MPVTRLADVLVPDVWVPYMQQRTKEKSALFQSGVITQNPEIDGLATGGGITANMPFFLDLTGESEVLSDTTPLGTNKITTGKDVCVKHLRGKAWGATDLAAALAGADPLAAIADLVGAWWARDFQKTLIASLRGVFSAASMSATHVLDLSINDGNNATAANKISAENTIEAFALLGDETKALTAIAMHSRLYHNLLKQNLIQFEKLSEQGEPIEMYLGRQIIVDDGLPRIDGTTSGFKYTSYLLGEGVVGYGEGDPKVPAESDRDILQGEEILVNRRHYIMHPGGVKWKGVAAGASPTNAELALGTNWERVYETKNVPMVALITNG
jgi:Major capsid protein 13-like